MALKYLRSAAAGTGTGADWTNAYTTLVLAFAGMAAGDTLYVADDHAETQASTMTLTSPGTASSPARVLCVNTHVTVPPTALATSATITTTGSFGIAWAAGYAYIYGVIFTAGSGAVASGSYLTFSSNGVSYGWTLDNCKLRTAGTSGNVSVQIGVASGSAGRQYVRWINTTLKLSGAVTTTGLYFSAGRFVWAGGSFDATGTIPTTMFWGISGVSAYADISGVDLSAVGSGKNLLNHGANPAALLLYLRNCKLGSSVTALAIAISTPSAELLLDNCDSGNTNYRMEHYKYQGSIVQETTKVRTSGASDGTTPLSHKFVTLSSGPTLFSPLEGPWMSAWNETAGSALTATVEVLHDSLTALTDAEIWLEVEYLGTASLPQSVYLSDRAADAFATPANQTASTAAWTTTGITNVNKQKLEVTFTPQVKGPVRWRVCMAKANYTVFVDPVASGLAMPSRDYLIPGTAYVNETGAGAALSRIRTGF